MFVSSLSFLFFLLFLVLSYFLEAEVSKPHDFRNFLGLFSLLSLSRLRSVGGLWGEENGKQSLGEWVVLTQGNGIGPLGLEAQREVRALGGVLGEGK